MKFDPSVPASLIIFNDIANYIVFEFCQISMEYVKFNLLTIIAIGSTMQFGLKFVLIIAFLILIRGGTPRYRYDYLTKLGWLKFLLLSLCFFLTLATIAFLY